MWEYGFTFPPGPEFFIQRVQIERDSVVEGVSYAVQRTTLYFNGPGAPPTSDTRLLVRFDADAARAVTLDSPGPPSFLTCPFDTLFGVQVDCSAFSPTPNDPEYAQSSGGLGGTVEIGGLATPVEARKAFVYGAPGRGADLYAAPIGFVRNTSAFCEGCFTQLRYARVGRVEYGRPFTSSESVPVAEARLAVWPNPASDRVTVALPAGAEWLVVTDLLGREVASRRARLGATEALDVSAWPPGVYVVRAGGAVARFTVVR